MDAHFLLHERHQTSENSFAELRVWRVASPVRGSEHIYKYEYSQAFVVKGECVQRYDNEAGKGNQ